MVFTSYRVGAKNSGTRFLSFVDTMLGYRHLLTPEDINKAASMCTSLKGVLRSRFLVLSDDRDPPPLRQPVANEVTLIQWVNL